jgi:hypothetical protein
MGGVFLSISDREESVGVGKTKEHDGSLELAAF